MAIIKALKGDYLPAAGNDLFIIDLDTSEKLGLMGIPKELDYTPESNWATQKVPGRNTPHYHYVGSEDTLTLDLSWWATEDDKIDVISRCKWLESLTKSDGWLGRPHLVKLHWGSLFGKAKWIVTAAPYKLSTFDKTRGYRPTHATQQITLKRYEANNRTTEQVIDWQT